MTKFSHFGAFTSILYEKKGKEEMIKEQIKLLCAEQLPEYVQPVDYKFRESLPLTSVGKIDYISLEKEDENIKNKAPQKALKKI